MSVKLLIEHHLDLLSLSLKGGCTGSSVSTLVKMQHCWKSHFEAHMYLCDQQRLRPACADAQSDQSLCLSLEYSMSVKLLTEHHLDLLSLKGGYTGSAVSTLIKIKHCWKSHVEAHMYLCDQQRLRPACADAQSDQSLCLSLTEHHLHFLGLKGGCTGSSGSTLVKMPHCWKSRVTAQFLFQARPTTFNRGILANVGFLAAQSTGLYNCYVIHDVDLFPLNDRNTYSCSNQFRHLSIENSKYKKG